MKNANLQYDEAHRQVYRLDAEGNRVDIVNGLFDETSGKEVVAMMDTVANHYFDLGAGDAATKARREATVEIVKVGLLKVLTASLWVAGVIAISHWVSPEARDMIKAMFPLISL